LLRNPRFLFPISVLRDIYTIGAFVPPTTAMLYSPHMAPKEPDEEAQGGVTYHIDGELVPVLTIDVSSTSVWCTVALPSARDVMSRERPRFS
jgi:hypothetical protein